MNACVPVGQLFVVGSHARYLRGMLAELPRKSCWSIADHAGETSPDGMQHLCEDLRALLVDEHLAVEFHKAHVGVLDPPAAAAHHPITCRCHRASNFGDRP